jgi:hypothetical protein
MGVGWDGRGWWWRVPESGYPQGMAAGRSRSGLGGRDVAPGWRRQVGWCGHDRTTTTCCCRCFRRRRQGLEFPIGGVAPEVLVREPLVTEEQGVGVGTLPGGDLPSGSGLGSGGPGRLGGLRPGWGLGVG